MSGVWKWWWVFVWYKVFFIGIYFFDMNVFYFIVVVIMVGIFCFIRFIVYGRICYRKILDFRVDSIFIVLVVIKYFLSVLNFFYIIGEVFWWFCWNEFFLNKCWIFVFFWFWFFYVIFFSISVVICFGFSFFIISYFCGFFN